jgi:hypothetical protein
MDAFERKIKPMLHQNKALNFFTLLFAFLFGNLFILTYSSLNWSLFLIFSIIFLLELGTQFMYSRVFFYRKQRKNLKLGFVPKTAISGPDWFPKNVVWPLWKRDGFASNFGTGGPTVFFISLNTMKRGFLLGFFIEAFKVGS